MADYYGNGRTNYFPVKNAQAFKDDINKISGVEVISRRIDDTMMFGLVVTDDYGWPSTMHDEETDEYDDVDWEKLFKKHLRKGAVAVIQEVGSEKDRYYVGYSWAINSEGKTISLNINDIYTLIDNQALGKVFSFVEY